MSVKTLIKVVSLSRSLERRQTFLANAKTQLPWSFFDAHEHLDPALSYDPADALLTLGAPLRPGELGCYSSHFTVWRAFLASSYDQLIVLEDDVVVDWGYLDVLVHHDFEKTGIRYLRLFAKRPASFRHVMAHFPDFDHDLIQFTGFAWGTQGYLLTRTGAARFVQRMSRVKRNIDKEMDRAWSHGVANLAIFPFPLFELFGPSIIGNDRFEPKNIPVFQKLRRLPVRVIERTLRVSHFFSLYVLRLERNLTDARPRRFPGTAAM